MASTRSPRRRDFCAGSFIMLSAQKTRIINGVFLHFSIEFTQFSIRQRSKVVTAFDSNGSIPSAIKSLRGRRFESCRCRFFCFFGLALLGVAVSVPLIEWRTTIRSGFVLLDRYIPPYRIILWKGVDQRLSFAQTDEKRTCTHSVLIPPRYYQHSSMGITNRHKPNKTLLDRKSADTWIVFHSFAIAYSSTQNMYALVCRVRVGGPKLTHICL
jgi:hypothetical protein